MALTTARVWTSDLIVAGNTARQLLVPNGSLDVLGEGERLTVSNRFGRWRATHDTTEVAGDLAAVLPRLSSSGRVSWVGNRLPFTPAQVVESHRGAFEFRSFEEPNSLRRPQIGALHSIMGYWSSGLNTPGIVVMPTGTGKTETMLALLVAARPGLLLVIVPTVALRDQIAGKFESLGVLQELQIVSAQAQRPVVGRLAHGLPTAEEADQFASACNVIVATPPALAACSDEARSLLYAACTHLVVDEAHHSAAPTWASIISTFANRPTLLFTATPFREDGHALPGRIIYRFPLREAQADGYFTHIDYRAVLSLQGIDEEVARLAIMRLREDLAAGFDHILMARASSIAGAERLLKTYSEQAAGLGPMVIHERLTAKKRTKTFAALESRECRVIICVDMLGEGFDLPSLKVAALHDVRKSLSPMIQLIGRFSRTSADASIGTASVFVARDPSVALSPLRELLREDADWNLILRDITERATVAAEEANDFELSFSNTPDDVPLSLLEPKVSAIVHRASTSVWNPEGVLELYEEGEVLGGSIAVGADGSVAWFVIDSRSDVRWGRVPGLEQRTYELIIMYFDQSRRLLYIHGSSNADNYAELANAVLGEGTSPINGPLTFRVLARLDRLVPTNVGLLDARDHFKRFSMHVGSDVNEALEGVDSFSKTQTHIATTGFDNGERITISAAVSGRIWSMRTATNLKEWVDWCNEQGAKLIDQSIEVTELFSNLMIPIDLEQRPPYVLLGVEWPWTVYLGSSDGLAITYSDTTYSMTDIDFEVDDFGTAGPFRFSLVTPGWRLPYEASSVSPPI